MAFKLKVFNLKSFHLSPSRSAANSTPAFTGFALTRHFVLTGDERCPIAGIWSRIDTTAQPDQPADPSLTRPAMGAALWRAIHLLFTSLDYFPA